MYLHLWKQNFVTLAPEAPHPMVTSYNAEVKPYLVLFLSWTLSHCSCSPTWYSICLWHSVLISFAVLSIHCGCLVLLSNCLLRWSMVMLLSVFRPQIPLFCSFSRLSSIYLFFRKFKLQEIRVTSLFKSHLGFSSFP